MLRGTRLAGGLLGLALLLGACGGAQGVQDAIDQAALRRRFGLPRRAEVVNYRGYPSMVGFGQREGLGLSATFQLEPEPAQSAPHRTLSEARRAGIMSGLAARQGYMRVPSAVGGTTGMPMKSAR